jgi:hypothetical protein
MKNDIEVIVFDAPAGNIAALVSGSVEAQGKRRSTLCNVNARVYTDRAPDVSINSSRGLSLTELAQTIAMLQDFETKLRDLVAAYSPSGTLTEPSAAASVPRAL